MRCESTCRLLKGGRLAALAYPATVVALLLSDVIGDAPDVIGSGPTAPDLSTFADALAVLSKFDLLRRVPREVRERLEAGVRGEIAETPKPGDAVFESVHNVIVGSNRLALRAAAREAKALGYRALILSSTIQGETREVAGVHAQILREVASSGNPVAAPACILSGGETTVTVRGDGKGGRNQEFALAAAMSHGRTAECDGAERGNGWHGWRHGCRRGDCDWRDDSNVRREWGSMQASIFCAMTLTRFSMG